jgi:small subunit ribosomal protein S16
MGRKGRPSYRIVAMDAAVPRGGRVIENLGSYEPLHPDPEKQVAVDIERAKHWVSVGAEATETVASILKKRGVEARTK